MMIKKTQEGWMVNTKSVISSVEALGGHFHVENVAHELVMSGATVIERLTSEDRISNKVTIGINQIRAILNTYSNHKKGCTFLIRHGQGWYEVNKR